MSNRAELSIAHRVLFVVPGDQVIRDGITDYTFWLAAAAGRAGVDCLIFALFPFDDEQEGYSARFPKSGPGHLTVILATDGSLTDRLAQLSDAKQKFNPDWISIQFTPGTFRNGRFFLSGLRSLSRALDGQTPICLTVHESARVLNSDKTWRDRILGRIRCFEIVIGLRKLRANKIFTSNPQHHQDLARAGLKSHPIPIFSNIPHGSTAASISDSGVPLNTRIALLFGRISADWDPLPVLTALSQETHDHSRPLVIVSIGVVGHRNLGWQQVVKVADTLNLTTYALGPLPAQDISAWLQRADYGLSLTPFQMWQKSSTCAAMLLHDLPLIFSDGSPNDRLLLPARFAVVQSGALHWTDAPADRCAPPPSADHTWAEMQLF